MTVRSIVEMFENLAVSGGSDQAAHTLEEPGHGNVYGLVTYYDGLAMAEEPRIIVPTKTLKFKSATDSESAVSTPDTTDVDEDLETGSNQETSDEETAQEEECSIAAIAPPTVVQDMVLPVSKIPQPKSREYHQAAASVRKPSLDDSKSVARSFIATPRAVSSAPSSLYIPPPTPVSSRVRGPRSSYAAFVSRIEHSQSRLLDFEKDERWLGQVETMKGRVEALKRRSHVYVEAATPRKSRSMSECSANSTASTTSLSSTDTLEQV